MPVIPAPHEHLNAAIEAIIEHRDHHKARIEHHQGEVAALYDLQRHYEEALRAVMPTPVAEPPTVATAIAVVNPKPVRFDDVLDTLVPTI